MSKLLSPVTIVVDPNGRGHVRTIAQAAAALPATGGIIALAPGVHVINAGINFPALTSGCTVIIEGQGGLTVGSSGASQVSIVGAITAFTLLGYLSLIIRDVEIYGDSTSNQNLLTPGVGSCDLYLERCAIWGVRVVSTTYLNKFRMTDSQIVRVGAVASNLLGGSTFIEMLRSVIKITT